MKKIILVIAIVFCSFTQAQNILIVDNNVNVDTSASHMFSTFAAANTAAVNGDIIYVQPSETNYGTITIGKEITLYGNGHTPELNGGRKAIFGHITITASNVKISGVETGPNLNVAISGTRSNITIENSKVYNIRLDVGITNNIIIQGNIIESSILLHPANANSVNVTITNNFINSPVANPFQYFNSTTIFNNNVVNWEATTAQSLFFIPTDLVAQNNIFVSQSSFNGSIWQTAGTPTIFNNCLTYSFSGVTLGVLNGTGNFDNINPVFTSIPGTNPAFLITNNYNIGSGSLGTDSNPVGIFNGNYDFDMRGYPTLLPYLTEMTISNNMVSAGDNLSVNLKANANKSN
ncbi:MAG: hypothetical protein COB73_07875 [Flavobacteriaceae bacterium]|nr:MAG: hypothetical protein COB73_07875 [Flavobacteriaceae bacterium]